MIKRGFPRLTGYNQFDTCTCLVKAKIGKKTKRLNPKKLWGNLYFILLFKAPRCKSSRKKTFTGQKSVRLENNF